MSIFGQPPGQGGNNSATGSSGSNPTSVYGRGDLQAAFNWLVNQPEHIRKQASDPDRLMTLYYRSSGRPEMVRAEVRSESRSEYRNESARIETEAPVSGQNFISDLRQINEAMRQFDGPSSSGNHSGAGAVSANSYSQGPGPSPSQNQFHGHGHSPAQVPQSSAYQAPMSYPSAPVHSQPAYQAPIYQSPTVYQNPMPPSYSPPSQPSPLAPTSMPAQTQKMLAEVREKLNLSSDVEALNVLIALGYRNLKPLLG